MTAASATRAGSTSSRSRTVERPGAASPGRRTRPTAGSSPLGCCPDERRRGTGTALLRELVTHLDGLGFAVVSSHVDGADAGSLAFAHRFGFEEVDRQVEQVRVVGDEARPAPPDGVELVSVAERPELLAEAYDLAVEGYADMATSTPVTVALEDWLVEEATLPGGSFVALADGEVVGFSGLCRLPTRPSRRTASPWSDGPGGGAGWRRPSSAQSWPGPRRTGSARW